MEERLLNESLVLSCIYKDFTLVNEVNEDYFPLMVEDFLEIMMYSCYNLDYFKRFRVPFLDEKIKKDFNGIVLTDYTHIKAVFSKKKYQL